MVEPLPTKGSNVRSVELKGKGARADSTRDELATLVRTLQLWGESIAGAGQCQGLGGVTEWWLSHSFDMATREM